MGELDFSSPRGEAKRLSWEGASPIKEAWGVQDKKENR